MSKKIHTIQSSGKVEFDKEVNFFLELGCELLEGSYEVVKEDNGKTYARAGLAPQCNNGVMAIDEMGQMNQFNLSGLHEVMEQRQCSISKAGHNLTLEANTSILGAANPKFGKYDPEET